MTKEFRDLLEPIELLEPFCAESELNLALAVSVKCAVGYICNVGITQMD